MKSRRRFSNSGVKEASTSTSEESSPKNKKHQCALLIENQGITEYPHLEGRQVTHQAGVPKTACSKINNSIWALRVKAIHKVKWEPGLSENL
jgi:hypothetical protein